MKRKLFIIILTLAASTVAGCATKTQIREDAPPGIEAAAREVGDQQKPDRTEEKLPTEQQADIKGTTAPEFLPRQQNEAEEEESVAHLKTVYFDFDSWLLTAAVRAQLAENAKWIAANTSPKIRIEGHTDERGADSYNLALGEKRAKAVAEYLRFLGIDKNRLAIVSYGEEKPAMEGQNEEVWRKNRRVEFRVIK